MYSENQGADHSPYPDDERDTEYSQGLDEAPGAYIEKITDINESLKEEFPTISTVSGHNDYASKACPCFDVGQWLSE